MSIKLVTGNLLEALQKIKPQVMVNISDPTCKGMNTLSQILYRDYPEYQTMARHLVHSRIPRHNLPGTYMYRRDKNDVVHILGFISPDHPMTPNVDRSGEILKLLTQINEDMMISGLKSVILPYCGRGLMGMHFTDFIDLVSMTMDGEIDIYISIREHYAELSPLPCLRFLTPVPKTDHTNRRVIYSQQTPEPNQQSSIQRSTNRSPYANLIYSDV